MLEDMAKGLQGAIPHLRQAKEGAEATLNVILPQNVEQQMTPEQKEIIATARNAMNLKGTDIVDKLDHLTKTLRRCQL